MKPALVTLGVLLAMAGCASDPVSGVHSAHHPQPNATATPGRMDGMMKSMQEMHQRAAGSRTAEERARLMDEHMKLMQDGMAMMRRSRDEQASKGKGGRDGTPPSPESTDRRMDMMEMMMQMMVDREAMRTPAAR